MFHSKTRGRFTNKKAWDWYENTGWLCGFNYTPSTVQNSTEFWQQHSLDTGVIKRELSWAKSLGFNSCRVLLQYIVWKDDPEGFKKRFDEFLKLSSGFGIRVIPVLFDDCSFGDPPQLDPYLGKQRDPIPGMLMPSWTPSPGLRKVTDPKEYPLLEKYVQDVISRFARDNRIVLWDLYNEPGFPGIGDKSMPLVEAAFIKARDSNPEQPITVCIWNIEDEQFNREIIRNSDIVSFHAYTDFVGLQNTIENLGKYGYPLICTEWMGRLSGSNIEKDLPLFFNKNVGCHIFGFVNGLMQAQYPMESRRGSKEPERWMYDLLHRDGTPYDPNEIDIIRKVTDVAKHKSQD